MEHVYKIKTALQIPMALAGLLGLPILYDVYSKGLPGMQITLITMLMLFFYVMTINNLVRRVITRPDGLDVITYLGKKSFKVDDITNIDGYSMGTRQFIIITSAKRPFFIQNSFTGFMGIIADLHHMLPDEKIKEGLREIQKNPLIRTGDTTAAWLTVLIMAAIILRTFFWSFIS